ncbi:MAG: hypothetical protein FJ280_23055 [Planctomycetes bacterium]|nr:hypothetical protein [Planctomycetota bacterium]
MVKITGIDSSGPTPGFGYLVCKAERYLAIGPDKYRKADYFKMPPVDSSPETMAAIHRGMEQICQRKGTSRENPFVNLGVHGFHATLATLHFELERQSIEATDGEAILDRMRMKHRVTGMVVELFNKVSIDSAS